MGLFHMKQFPILFILVTIVLTAYIFVVYTPSSYQKLLIGSYSYQLTDGLHVTDHYNYATIIDRSLFRLTENIDQLRDFLSAKLSSHSINVTEGVNSSIISHLQLVSPRLH